MLWDACVKSKPTDETLILIYFSGHGTLHPVTERPSLVLYNTTQKDPDSTGIPFTWLYELIGTSRANLILVIDACFSGNIASMQAAKGLATLLQAKAIFASCAEGTESFAAPDGARSLFTHQFITGLQGAAASEGYVTTTSLSEYLKESLATAEQQPICMIPEVALRLAVPGKPTPASGSSSTDIMESLGRYVRKRTNEFRASSVLGAGLFVRPSASAHSIIESTKSVSTTKPAESVETNVESTRFCRAALRKSAIQGADVNLQDQEPFNDDDALTLFDNWFRSKSPLALIVGDTGIGKTTLLKRLWLDIGDQWIKGDVTTIPLFVDLRIFADVRLHGRSARAEHSPFAEARRKFRAVPDGLFPVRVRPCSFLGRHS